MSNFGLKVLACIVCFFGMSLFGERVLADYDIQSSEIKVDPTYSKVSNRQSITNNTVEIYGPVEEKTFFYEVKSKIPAEGNEVVLQLKHSELLIAPSAVTISIDDVTVQSIPLKEGSLTNKVVIPLTGQALSTGFHTVKVTFNGVIKEGVCVDQETPGNWLTIGIDSYLQLQGQTSDNPSLSDYPASFSAVEGQTVSVILPDNASLATRSAGASIAAYLGSKSYSVTNVRVQRESKMDMIGGNFIVIGSQSEFQTKHIKSLIAEADVKVPEKGLSVSRHQVNGSVESLFILSKTPEQFRNRIGIFLEDSISKQLTGQQMTITSTPEVKKNSSLMTLKQFGVSDLTFDRATKEGDTYFGYAPASGKASPTLELLLRRSDTLKYRDSEEESESVGDEVELVVHINNVPHPIDIRDLNEEDNGVFSIQVPIEETTIEGNHLMALRFEVNGLRRNNPCYSNNENRWVYLSEDSYFTFQKGEPTSKKTLTSFPYPFSDSSQKTKIVLPVGKEVEDDELMRLMSSLTSFGKVPSIELVQGDKFDEVDAKDSHLVFLGGPGLQPELKKVERELIVPYKDVIPDLQPFGFLQEAVQQVAWIQENPWSKKKHTMIVFDTVSAESQITNERFLESLTNLSEPSTVAIQTKEQQFYTNADEFEMKKGSLKGAQTSDSENPIANSKWWIAGFGVVLVLTFVLYMSMKQKRRKNRAKL